MWDGELKLRVGVSVGAGAGRVTERVGVVAGLFGVGLERGWRVLVGEFDFCLSPGTVTLITGPSGAGKSMLLNAMEAGVAGRVRGVRLEGIPLEGDLAVVDCFSCSLEETLSHLGRAGLSEAHLLLRSPVELSEGQRFRYRLARFFASDFEVLIADEFGATLDRITAKLLAWQVRKFVSAGSGKAVILATTHEDLREDLRPDCWIYKGLGEGVRISLQVD